MSEKKLTLLGLIIATISVVVAVVIPEIRIGLGLDQIKQEENSFSSQNTAKENEVFDLAGESYKYSLIAGKHWTLSNMNYYVPNSLCFDMNDSICKSEGKLYTWEAAKIACASLGGNWKVPSVEDWKNLCDYYGGYYFTPPFLVERTQYPEGSHWRSHYDRGDVRKSAKSLVEGGISGLNLRFSGEGGTGIPLNLIESSLRDSLESFSYDDFPVRDYTFYSRGKDGYYWTSDKDLLSSSNDSHEFLRGEKQYMHFFQISFNSGRFFSHRFTSTRFPEYYSCRCVQEVK